MGVTLAECGYASVGACVGWVDDGCTEGDDDQGVASASQQEPQQPTQCHVADERCAGDDGQPTRGRGEFL